MENLKRLLLYYTDGVNVISIGVGNKIDYDELECIEGDNGASSHIFDVKDLAGLKDLAASSSV